MAFDYSSFQSIAISEIANKGQSLTLTRVTTGAFNPATSEITGDSTADETIKAVVTEFKEKQIDGSTVQRGDKLLLVSPDFDAPTLKDKITISGLEYSIINVDTVSPAGVDILYKIQVRR